MPAVAESAICQARTDAVPTTRRPFYATSAAGGGQCTRKATYTDGKHIFCTQHAKLRATVMRKAENRIRPECRPLGQGADLWNWLAQQVSLSLDWHDEPEEDPVWQVHRVSGGVNDREWKLIASGETPLAAVQAARAALLPQQPSGQGSQS